jgi:hypothetical protein
MWHWFRRCCLHVSASADLICPKSGWLSETGDSLLRAVNRASDHSRSGASALLRHKNLSHHEQVKCFMAKRKIALPVFEIVNEALGGSLTQKKLHFP